MAFSTLDAIRTGGLNLELGLTADNDDTWGTTAQRNFYIQRAFARLWPEMGRARKFALTLVTNQSQYDLTTLNIAVREITGIVLFDSAGIEADAIRSWNLYVDEDDDTPAARLVLPAGLDSSYSCAIYGYTPYIVPASAGASCDLPPSLEYVVTAGARAEAYRAKLNAYANYPRLANENRANALSAGEIIELMRTAVAEFREARSANAKETAAPRRAMRATR
jgi:hypothetical protein